MRLFRRLANVVAVALMATMFVSFLLQIFFRYVLDSPLGWTSRDHRKMIAIDGAVAFVTGLCVGQAWVGDPSRGVAPWRPRAGPEADR